MKRVIHHLFLPEERCHCLIKYFKITLWYSFFSPFQIQSSNWICLLLTTVASQKCPSRWLERPNGDSCYRLWPMPLKTWKEARSACQTYDGDLLKLDSQEEKVKSTFRTTWWSCIFLLTKTEKTEQMIVIGQYNLIS